MAKAHWAMLAVAALLPAGSAVAGEETPFALTPVPRWSAEPETEEVCRAIAAECPGFAKDGEVSARIDFDELYDARGMLAGIRMTKSTGCKPLDESTLLGQRRFKLVFHKDDRPDLDGIHLEVKPGVDPAGVRIVKESGTSITLGC